MSDASAPMADPLAEALLAAQLFLTAPQRFGGLALRGGGPARDVVVDMLKAALPDDQPWRRLPANVDDDRLLGGIDLAASLAGGTPVCQAGLLEEVTGGVLVIPMAERVCDEVAGKVAQAMDAAARGDGFATLLLDDGLTRDEHPPANLTDRVAFLLDLSEATRLDVAPPKRGNAIAVEAVAPASDEDLAALAATAVALGIESARPMIFALETARAHAALMGRRAIAQEDLQTAARLVLAPRATRLPPDSHEEQVPPDTEEPSPQDNADNDSDTLTESPPEDLVLEAALAALPPDILEQIAQGRPARSTGGGGTGKRARSTIRGKPLGARPGVPRGGARLALIDSLRAAAPWQPLRRRDMAERQQETGREPHTNIIVHKDDLRIRRFEERMASVTVFCVDASGSAAMARLAEAKGAVELILAQAYVKRSEVALIAFRGDSAEVLLPPTRSLTRARRALAELPGGGGTPLAAGLQAGQQMSDLIASRGRTPFLVVLTDGSANIAADGTPGRAQAKEDAHIAAKRIAASQLDALVIDISPRARPDAERLAQAMRARYLPLPMADAAALQRAVSAAQPEPAPA